MIGALVALVLLGVFVAVVLRVARPTRRMPYDRMAETMRRLRR